ncbi:MAG: restriction endonuclease subunit S [Leptolyngbya sp. SIOISBB]|nr:restriction endonuclease subunit S [Leptolyngbya sp. SIOISBB]
MSGAVEARKLLEDISMPTEPLKEITENGLAGIYHAGRIKRLWVDSPKHGYPFLSSTDILQADLSELRNISKISVDENPQLIIQKDWTLITRSGSIGKTAYARAEMNGMACTEDVLRVVPDDQKVLPGYLYTYLSSKFGMPLVTSGTYGAIIQHIEPHHIADIPVPRITSEIETKIHNLIQSAADLRSEANRKRQEAINKVEQELNWNSKELYGLSNIVDSNQLIRRFDGFYHSHSIASARNTLASHPDSILLEKVVKEVFEPNRGARIKVKDLDYGVPFLSSSEVFRLDPTGEYLVSKNMPHFERLLIYENDLLLPRSGQVGGIIGRAVLPLATNYGHAATEHLVRIRCSSREDAWLLWAIFASQPGYYAAIGTAYGTSIPSLDCELLSQLQIPWIQGEFREEIVELVSQKITKLTEAIHKERTAIQMLENHIESLEAA